MRVGVLFSGRGSNLGALIRATMHPEYPAQVAIAICNKPNAGGLKIAKEHNVDHRVVDQGGYETREDHEAAMTAVLEQAQVDIVCLAGYMRLLTDDFVRRFEGRMINIHPSLLPLFPGLDTHARALAAGMRVHGCTVHFVTERMDEGPIIAQAAIAIEPGDTPEILAQRLLRAEHRLYPHALRMALTGEVRMVNGQAAYRRRAQQLPADEEEPARPPQILLSPDARRD